MPFGFLGLLFFVFLVLKLAGVIAWSWFWVVSPLLAIPVLVVVGIMWLGWVATRMKP